MTKRKRLTELEKRLTELENKLNSLFCAPPQTQKKSIDEKSYEEVINEWLNGKKTNAAT